MGESWVDHSSHNMKVLACTCIALSIANAIFKGLGLATSVNESFETEMLLAYSPQVAE